MTAYREGPGEQRRELLERREELLAEPLGTCSAGCRNELEGLRRRLETAEDDPLDHVQQGLRLYAMTLEAGRAAGQQQGLRRRFAVTTGAVLLGSLLALIVGRIGYQYATYDFLMNPCSNGWVDGKRHFVIGHDGMLGLDFRCEAKTDEDCAEPCAREGYCVAEAGRCVPRSDADCRQSEICAYHGECERDGDRCVAANDADCRASDGCKLDGVCTFTGRRCEPRSDGDCKASARCRDEGFCRLGFSSCEQEHAPVVDECTRMSHCVETGICAPQDLPQGCIARGPAYATVTSRDKSEPNDDGIPLSEVAAPATARQ